jgi:hypothetical protein
VLAAFAACATTWANGGEPTGLQRVAEDVPPTVAASRDVFVFMINGAKERAPAAAIELISKLRA